jgi:hypothetical protein
MIYEYKIGFTIESWLIEQQYLLLYFYITSIDSRYPNLSSFAILQLVAALYDSKQSRFKKTNGLYSNLPMIL